jgi:hypothetical protein
MIFVFNRLFWKFSLEEKTAVLPRRPCCSHRRIATGIAAPRTDSRASPTKSGLAAPPWRSRHPDQAVSSSVQSKPQTQSLYSIVIYDILSLRRRMRQSAAIQETRRYENP